MATPYSGHSLIPHLNVLQNLYLHRERLTDDEFRTMFYDLELLPYTLGLSWHAVSELARTQSELSANVPDEVFTQADIHGLGDPARDRMTYALDAFLDAARRSQNAVIHYLRLGLSLDLPMSMNKVVSRLRRQTIRLPERAQTNILKYWAEHGQRLKDYRDLAQHHALVSSDARLFKAHTGQRALYFALPSNPEVKTPARLRFAGPPVHAFPYILNEFLALVSILHWLTAGLVPSGLKARMSLVVFRDGLTLSLSGHVIPTQATVDDEVNRLRQALEKRA